ncbi:hydroxypyruvate isomerase family protein [Enterococcus sp. HY326]|uniref:hydroxypyruvate isomerase family protein n=1 Tax=Enterococcus sp. HY326 TaxID=2971265 RepID=UPI00223FE184|nr:TIM barrel protein [Enterococcus sp. HY326]
MNFPKCACIDAMYTEIPFYDRFQAAKDDGFEYIEFWSWTDKDLDKIVESVKKSGIKISGFNGDADYSLIDPTHKTEYLKFLKQSIEAAKKIGSLSLTIHSNALGDLGVVLNHYTELSDTVKICSMYDMLLDCAKLAEEHQIDLNLEPLNIYADHVGNYLATTQMAAEMIQLIGSPRLKVLYDVYHMQINEGNLSVNMTKYLKQIGHIHVADNPGRHEPGTGEINYTKVFEMLEEIGYQGRVGYELFPATTTKEAVKAIMSY